MKKGTASRLPINLGGKVGYGTTYVGAICRRGKGLYLFRTATANMARTLALVLRFNWKPFYVHKWEMCVS